MFVHYFRAGLQLGKQLGWYREKVFRPLIIQGMEGFFFYPVTKIRTYFKGDHTHAFNYSKGL
ncbi:hypothetical protein LPE01_05670 [Lactiplantibacillus pentosus]|nr:hypothetical protein LPE01_05670 [Lactiplantibacillus pentosus]